MSSECSAGGMPFGSAIAALAAQERPQSAPPGRAAPRRPELRGSGGARRELAAKLRAMDAELGLGGGAAAPGAAAAPAAPPPPRPEPARGASPEGGGRAAEPCGHALGRRLAELEDAARRDRCRIGDIGEACGRGLRGLHEEALRRLAGCEASLQRLEAELGQRISELEARGGALARSQDDLRRALEMQEERLQSHLGMLARQDDVQRGSAELEEKTRRRLDELATVLRQTQAEQRRREDDGRRKLSELEAVASQSQRRLGELSAACGEALALLEKRVDGVTEQLATGPEGQGRGLRLAMFHERLEALEGRCDAKCREIAASRCDELGAACLAAVDASVRAQVDIALGQHLRSAVP